MKKWILFIATILSLCTSVVRADNLADGIEAHKKGNYAQALELLLPLATQGNAEAQLLLGWLYANGEGVTKNDQEAAKWYRLAAEQGYADAQYSLGVMHKKGKGVTQDYQQALKWHRLAAAQGDAYAQYNLGMMYANGDGVTQDYVRAHMWFSFAANKLGRHAKEDRDMVAKEMTPSQIADAQKMARDCKKKNYKNCE